MKGNRRIYYWLITGCILVGAMVAIGGITRLTQSGLSIVEWKPVVGTLPPLSEREWMEEFARYQESPEFKAFNYNFSLQDFKSIFWWEYIHRLLGRIIGLVFLVPFILFWIRKKLSSPLKKKLIFVFILGGFQGFLGWFMVKSGLVDNPHVSHYRLALHLVTALILLCYIYWVALWVRNGEEKLKISFGGFPGIILSFMGLVLIQIVYGAFVAGLDAGFQFNTFPLMGDSFVPDVLGHSMNDYGFRGVIDSPPVVQFLHRIIAYMVVLMLVVIWFRSEKFRLSRPAVKALKILSMAVGIQVLLGIFTLILTVPVSMGVLHQVGAIFVLLACLYLLFSLWNPLASAEV